MMMAKIKCIQCAIIWDVVIKLGNVGMQSLARYFLRYFSLTVVFITSSLLRVVLLVYAEWQDNLFALKFTDVDYQVLADAARYVLDGELPFVRPTYRYSPLLAQNHQVFSSFGKVVFVFV